MATSLLRISAPLTLASTGCASSARPGPANGTRARQPVTAAEARPWRRPVFVTGNEVVMENPCAEVMALGRPDTRPIAGPWQRENSVKIMNFHTGDQGIFARLQRLAL